MRRTLILMALSVAGVAAMGQDAPRRHTPREAFETDTPMVHDPVMAVEVIPARNSHTAEGHSVGGQTMDGEAKADTTYYLFCTGMGLQQMTSKDRRIWTVKPEPVMTVIPKWTRDSVPGFRSHVWAPDVIRWHGRWWMSYSCSTFGRNGSAIGLLSTRSLAMPIWQDEGCIVCSREGRDNWNAIDPNFVIDDADQPWLVWGSFWDGIQLCRLDTTMHIAKGEKPRTIARRYLPAWSLELSEGNMDNGSKGMVLKGKDSKDKGRNGKGGKAISPAPPFNPNHPKNPTSDFAGPNAIEAPFILKHGGWYYLFVSWDYCCQGSKSNYRVAVGRSRSVEGPYFDREGNDMAYGGGTLFIEGDRREYDAAGHCAAYTIGDRDIFICHGYSIAHGGASVLIQRDIKWTPDGWPTF